MMKVQILDRCPYCDGVSMVLVGQDTDFNGNPFDRYRPCYSCHGSGFYPRWITLDAFAELLASHQCSHEHTSTRGGMHYSDGEAWDNIQEFCDDCGAHLD